MNKGFKANTEIANTNQDETKNDSEFKPEALITETVSRKTYSLKARKLFENQRCITILGKVFCRQSEEKILKC